ncbi:helix-turn-helix domain-containing protein [Microbacterium sp. NPDC096154]|uniref:helix-turn-helix domain-containing protein n=1 Tax=Microbacterium sp. NPDC096154 TaxID=3155549 RepID=UPI00332632FF
MRDSRAIRTADAAAPPAPWQDAQAFLLVLEQIAKEANSVGDARQVLERIVNAVTQYGPWSICWAGILDVEGNGLRSHTSSGFAENAPPLPESEWTLFDSPSWIAVERHEPFVIYDALEDERFPLVRADASARGFRSIVILPLYLDDEEVGVIWFCAPQPKLFAADEIAFATVVASITSVALSNVQHQARQRELLQQEREQSTRLARLHDVVERQYADLQRLFGHRDRLLQAHLTDQGVTGLVRVVCDALGAPIVVLDRFGNLVAQRGDVPENCDVPEVVAIATRDALGLRTRAVELDGVAIALAPIHSGEERLGYLCCLADCGGFGPIELDLIEQACLHIALEFIKDRVRLEAHTRLFGDFVGALSAGDHDQERIEHSAGALGIDLRRRLRVFRARLEADDPRDFGDLLLFSRHLHRLLRSRFAENTVMPLGDRELLMVVQWPDQALEATAFTNEVRRLLSQAIRMTRGPLVGADAIGLTIGLGRAAVGADAVRASDEEARRALDIGVRMGRLGADVDLQSLGSYALITDLDPAQRRAFADRYLGPLRRYDRERGGEFVATLETHLATGWSALQTAQRLHVHVSTLKYRLKRIAELTGLSLEDPEQRLCLQLALHLERLDERPAARR